MSPKNPSEDVWLAEYNAYRLELLEIIRSRYLMLVIAMGAMGMVFGFVTDTQSPHAVLLIPIIGFALIAPLAYITHILSEHFHRVTAYIEVFVEPQIGLEREKAWNIYHKKFKHIAYTRPIMIAYATLFLISSFFPLVFHLVVGGVVSQFSQSHIIAAVIEAVTGLVIGVGTWHYWISARVRSDAKKQWEEIKKEMERGEIDGSQENPDKKQK